MEEHKDASKKDLADLSANDVANLMEQMNMRNCGIYQFSLIGCMKI